LATCHVYWVFNFKIDQQHRLTLRTLMFLFEYVA
jgi:hypothetical protein